MGWGHLPQPQVVSQYPTARGGLTPAALLLGTLAQRPAAQPPLAGFFFWATDSTLLYLCDGASWTAVAGALPLAVAQGGTGDSSLAANCVLVGEGTGAVNAAGPGTAGQVLTSNGSGSDPTFQAVSAATGAPVWTRYTATWSGGGGTVAFTDSTNGQAQTLTLSGMAAGTAIAALTWYVPTLFSGGGLSSFAFTIGYSGGSQGQTASNVSAYVGSTNALTGATVTAGQGGVTAQPLTPLCPNHTSTWNLTITATPDGLHSLSQATAGAIDVWALIGPGG